MFAVRAAMKAIKNKLKDLNVFKLVIKCVVSVKKLVIKKST